MIRWMNDVPPPGVRVRFKHRVDRFPDFFVPEGATGVVLDIVFPGHGVFYAVKLDEPLKGAEEWNNDVLWHVEHGDPREDLEIIEEKTTT